MHIVIGLVVGTALGILAGSAVVQTTAPAASLAVPAHKVPTELAIPKRDTWDI